MCVCLLCSSEQLSSGTSAVASPRLSPDQCRIVYLECSVYGPHMQCSRLCMVRQNKMSSPHGYKPLFYKTFCFVKIDLFTHSASSCSFCSVDIFVEAEFRSA